MSQADVTVSLPYGMVYGDAYALFSSRARAFAYRTFDSPFGVAPLVVVLVGGWTLATGRTSGSGPAVVTIAALLALGLHRLLVRLAWKPLVRRGDVVTVSALRAVLGAHYASTFVAVAAAKLDGSQSAELAGVLRSVGVEERAGTRSDLLSSKATLRRLVLATGALGASR